MSQTASKIEEPKPAHAAALPAVSEDQARSLPQTREPSIMEIVAAASANPNVDVAKMRELIELRNQEADRQAAIAFNTAMMQSQADMPRVLKRAENEHTHSTYETLDDLLSVITPILAANGFAVSFGTADCPKPDHYRVICKVSHEMGHSRDYQADIPSDAAGAKGNANKNPTQAFGSTMSYGRRYLLKMIFNLRTSDDDDGNGSSGTGMIDEDQKGHVLRLIEETGADIAKFCRFMGVQAVPDIKAADFAKAITALNEKKRAIQK